MARQSASFRQSDVKRAISGAVAAGVDVARIEIDSRTGNIIILTPRASSVPAYDLWKATNNAR